MSNNYDLSYLTNGDYQDYWNQFLRFYAKESGLNLSSKIPISYLEKKFRYEIIAKYELNVNPYSTTSVNQIVRQLIQKGAIEFETLSPEEKFTEKYKKALLSILNKLESNLNPAYNVEIIEDKPYEVRLYISIDIEDWLRLSQEEKRYASRIGYDFGKMLEKLLGVEFGSVIHGKLSYFSPHPIIKNFETWMSKVMNKKIKKELKESEFGRFVQRMKVVIINSNDLLNIQIVTPRNVRFSSQASNEMREFIPKLFEKLGYNPKSVEVHFV